MPTIEGLLVKVKNRLGLALGSGAARGWAHIGVLRELLKKGIEPDIVCGSSIGAFIGAAYVSGHFDELERWVCNLNSGILGKHLREVKSGSNEKIRFLK